jgi:hypothetical protein
VSSKWEKIAGRLAFRAEGNNWNAYYALPDTMEGALLLGSININLVTRHMEVQEAFKEAMKTALGAVLSGIAGGEDIGWMDERYAPEHERAGHG